jgi:sugar phosphate isomerase/epimerase
LEIGVMFWGGRDPVETLREVKGLGVRCGQIGLPGDMEIGAAAQTVWKAAIAAEQFTVVTVFAAFTGEDYADIPTVQRTVGFIPPGTRAERQERMLRVCDFAAGIGVGSVACHIGFVPEDTCDMTYLEVRDLTRRTCDYAAKYNMTFALETGQEPAHTLLHFFKDVGRANLKINFDPANLILYGTGDPIEALGVLGEHVLSVHAKDGDWPPKDDAHALGIERPLGQGAVGMARFVQKLKAIGYKNPMNVEREVPDHQQRLADIKMGVALLEKLR